VIAARRSASRLLLACGIALAVGCGSSPPLLRGSIVVDSNVNPDRAGRPSPIVVRVYELKSVAAFNSADFFALFDNEAATLSGELVGRDEFQLQPGETRNISGSSSPRRSSSGWSERFAISSRRAGGRRRRCRKRANLRSRSAFRPGPLP